MTPTPPQRTTIGGVGIVAVVAIIFIVATWFNG